MKDGVQYGVMPEQITQQLQSGGEFILIRKGYQSEPAQVWSTGDQEQTQALFREAVITPQAAQERELETTG